MWILSCIVLAAVSFSTINGYSVNPKQASELLPKMMNAASQCAAQEDTKVTPEFCITQWDGKHDPTDRQFTACTETMTCAVKKLGLMSDDGQWLLMKSGDVKDHLKEGGLASEYVGIYDKCKTVTGRNEEAVMHMVECLLENSEQFKENVQQLADQMQSSMF